jgi:hypothetical protein
MYEECQSDIKCMPIVPQGKEDGAFEHSNTLHTRTHDQSQGYQLDLFTFSIPFLATPII